MKRPITESPTEARQASKEGVGRYVLAISTTLAIIAMLLVYFLVIAG